MFGLRIDPPGESARTCADKHFPNWRKLSIHESSPSPRGISYKLKQECPGYIPTQFFPGEKTETVINGFRNENLEHRHLPMRGSTWS